MINFKGHRFKKDIIKLPPKIKNLQLKTIFPAIACALILGSCAIVPLLSSHAAPLPKVRFLLTFDDGPSPASEDNPTAKIADTLAANAVQAGIKAVFFGEIIDDMDGEGTDKEPVIRLFQPGPGGFMFRALK